MIIYGMEFNTCNKGSEAEVHKRASVMPREERKEDVSFRLYCSFIGGRKMPAMMIVLDTKDDFISTCREFGVNHAYTHIDSYLIKEEKEEMIHTYVRMSAFAPAFNGVMFITSTVLLDRIRKEDKEARDNDNRANNIDLELEFWKDFDVRACNSISRTRGAAAVISGEK